MSLYESKTYIEDLEIAKESIVGIEHLKNTSILVTGATGLIGSYIVDILLKYNKDENANIKIYALGRSHERLVERFEQQKAGLLVYIEHDVNEIPNFDFEIDYIIHAASQAYPAAFNADPVGTIMSNVLGTKLLLDYGKNHRAKKFMFVSSGEIYGQGDISLDAYEENYGGYVDSMQTRSCYPNSKRVAETLCVSYTKQYGLDTLIVRPCHTYGPNATRYDNRANVQFINHAINGENIVMKSAGTQLRSYCYIADCASAILTVLINGCSGAAYNIVNSGAKATIAEFAEIVARISGRKLEIEKPDSNTLAERTPIEKQVLAGKRLENLGWRGKYSVEEGIKHTMAILMGK